MRVRKEGWKGRINTFLHDLESGKFDPDLRESEAEPSSPVKETSNGDAAVAEDTKAIPNADDDMPFNVDADDDAADHDTNRHDVNGKPGNDNRRSNRGDEVSVPAEGNQVMIRTIPPDIGRVKLEEVYHHHCLYEIYRILISF